MMQPALPTSNKPNLASKPQLISTGLGVQNGPRTNHMTFTQAASSTIGKRLDNTSSVSNVSRVTGRHTPQEASLRHLVDV